MTNLKQCSIEGNQAPVPVGQNAPASKAAPPADDPWLDMFPKERDPEQLAVLFLTSPTNHNSRSRACRDLMLSAHLKFCMQMEHRSQLPECLRAPLKF